MGTAAAGLTLIVMQSRTLQQLLIPVLLLLLCHALDINPYNSVGVTVVWADAAPVQGEQDMEQGLNIDCGSTMSYVDGATNITWVPDADYITTGMSANVPEAQYYYPQFPEFTTLRYFPDTAKKKNCYSLPATPNNTYIIRATFFYGSYDIIDNTTAAPAPAPMSTISAAPAPTPMSPSTAPPAPIITPILTSIKFTGSSAPAPVPTSTISAAPAPTTTPAPQQPAAPQHQQVLPSFQIAVDETILADVSFQDASTFTYREFLVAAQSSVIYLCLVRGDDLVANSGSSGNPFVSSISLHPLPSYPESVLQDLQIQRRYYQTQYRLSFGGHSTDPIRSPSDVLDRYWTAGAESAAYVQATAGLQDLSLLSGTTGSSSSNQTVNITVPPNVTGQPPAAVLQSAVTTSPFANLTITLPIVDDGIVNNNSNSSSYNNSFINGSSSSTTTTGATTTAYYLGLYFAELNSTANAFAREFYVQVLPQGGDGSSSSASSGSFFAADSLSSSAPAAGANIIGGGGPLYENPYNMSGGSFIASQQAWQIVQYNNNSNGSSSSSAALEIVLFPSVKNATDALGPSLNALEFFHRIDATATRTNEQDALAIEHIKTWMNLTEWTGDPCLPYPHPWVTCSSVNMTSSPSIIAVDLSGYNLNETICPSFGKLSSLTSLSLANNSLMGPLPTELDALTNLTTLQLQNNLLSGCLPDWLTFLTQLNELLLQNNNFSCVIPDGLLSNRNLTFQYKPGNPSLTTPSTPKANTTSNTGVVVGAVVGGNVAQAAVVVLAVLYNQGKLGFSIGGLFKKIGSKLVRKTKDEIKEQLNPKDEHSDGGSDDKKHVDSTVHTYAQPVAVQGPPSTGGVLAPEGKIATAQSFTVNDLESCIHNNNIPNNNNNTSNNSYYNHNNVVAASHQEQQQITWQQEQQQKQYTAAELSAAAAAGTFGTIAATQAAAAGFHVPGSAAAVTAAASTSASSSAAGRLWQSGLTTAIHTAEAALRDPHHMLENIGESLKEQAKTSTKNLIMSGKRHAEMAARNLLLSGEQQLETSAQSLFLSGSHQVETAAHNLVMSGKQQAQNFISAGEQQAAAALHGIGSEAAAAVAHVVSKATAQWQHVLSGLDDERKQAEEQFSKLQSVKDEAEQDMKLFGKQIRDRQRLLQSASSKLVELQKQQDAETLKLNTFLQKLNNSSSTKFKEIQEAVHEECEAPSEATAAASEAVAAAASEASAAAALQSQISECEQHLATLRRKIDSQLGIVDAFKDLLDSGESERRELNDKLAAVESDWHVATDWYEACNRHRAALSSQLQSMAMGFQRPLLCPSPAIAVAGFNSFVSGSIATTSVVIDATAATATTTTVAAAAAATGEVATAVGVATTAVVADMSSVTSVLQKPMLTSADDVLSSAMSHLQKPMSTTSGDDAMSSAMSHLQKPMSTYGDDAMALVAATSILQNPTSTSSSADDAMSSATAAGATSILQKATSTSADAMASASASNVEALTISSPCPFCNRGFKPAWAALVVSCEHAYHIWCAVTHFSTSAKCLQKDCQQEMHDDFWRTTGIKKPTDVAGSNSSANSATDYSAALGAATAHATAAAHDLQANLQHQLEEGTHFNVQGLENRLAADITGIVSKEEEQSSETNKATGSKIKMINPLRILDYVIRIFRN